jgi:tetratricopeptide (TPR) repeat protein
VLAEAETVVTLNPNHAPGRAWFGFALARLGRPREALPHYDRAFRLSPQDPLRAIWHFFVGMTYVMLGEDLQALEEGNKAAATNPKFPTGYAVQASALALLGREAEARAALAVYQRLQPGITLARFKDINRSDNAEYLRLMERFYAGLRTAGLPE